MRGGVKVLSRVGSGRGEEEERRREECIWVGRSEDEWSKRGEEFSLKRIENV